MTSVYLDNAATTYPKPKEVTEAFLKAAGEAYGNAGRGSHRAAVAASEELYRCREAIASLFCGKVERVVFCQNATHALNLAIKGLTPDNSHLLISDIEHNAVLRPIEAMKERGVGYSFYSASASLDKHPSALLSSLEKALLPNTVGVIACHRSNILPIELPLEIIGRFCREKGLFFIVDASQSAGSADIDIEKAGITALCAPSHKGLYGFRGAGFVLFSKELPDETIKTLLEGGSGSDSKSPVMPSLLPERLEAGTQPVEIIASLRAGIDFVKKQTPRLIQEKERCLSAYLKDRLMREKRIRVYLPHLPAIGTVLFSLQNTDPSAVAARLSERGIALRDGLHCAPLAHRLIGTEHIGALRASFSALNSEADADALVYALRHIE